MGIVTLLNDCEMYGRPRLFQSDRCMNDEHLKAFNKNLMNGDEIVSFDCGLFEMEEVSEYTTDCEAEQILLIMVRPDVESMDEYIFSEINQFEFCGYDLVEFPTCTSALTNCGACFNKAVDYSSLNGYGLFSDYMESVMAQITLRKEYPEESHAYCEVVEIWRKLVVENMDSDKA